MRRLGTAHCALYVTLCALVNNTRVWPSLSPFLSLSCSIWRARFLPKLPTRRVWPPSFPFYCAHSTPHVSNWTQLDRVCGQQFPLSPLPFSPDLTFHADVVVVSGDGIKFNISVYKYEEKERYSNFRNWNSVTMGFLIHECIYIYFRVIFKDSNLVKILYRAKIFEKRLVFLLHILMPMELIRDSLVSLKTRLFATRISLYKL